MIALKLFCLSNFSVDTRTAFTTQHRWSPRQPSSVRCTSTSTREINAASFHVILKGFRHCHTLYEAAKPGATFKNANAQGPHLRNRALGKPAQIARVRHNIWRWICRNLRAGTQQATILLNPPYLRPIYCAWHLDVRLCRRRVSVQPQQARTEAKEGLRSPLSGRLPSATEGGKAKGWFDDCTTVEI
jgi:hypothetical protein